MNKYNVEITLSFVTIRKVDCSPLCKRFVFKREEWDALLLLMECFSYKEDRFSTIKFLHKFFDIELRDSIVLYDAAKEYDQ